MKLVVDAVVFGSLVLALWVKLVLVARALSCCGAFPQSAHPLSATAAILLLVAAALLRLPRVWRLASWLVFDTILTLLALADALYFRFFGDLLSVYEVAAAWQLTFVHSSVVTALKGKDLFYLADIVVGLCVLAYLTRSRVHHSSTPPVNRWVQAVLALSGLVLAMPSVRIVALDPDGVLEYTIGRRQVVAALGLVGYHVHDAAAYVVQRARDRRAVGDGERQRVRQFLQADRARNSPPSALFGVAKGRNVIIVQVESLQAFAVGLNVDGQPIAPRLTEFSRESLNFTNFLNQTYGGATSDAVFTSMQSLHPVSVGAVATRYPSIAYRGLPAVLHAAGYQTMAATGTRGEFWNLRLLFPALGFDSSFFPDNLEPGETFGQGLSDGDLFRQIPRLLANMQKPLMGFVVSVSSHHPFLEQSKHHQSLELGTLGGSQIRGYLNLINYFDSAFGAFIDQLRVAGLLDDSVVVVYGDHEGFLDETPELAKLAGVEPGSMFGWWRFRHRLPLMIRLPHGSYAGERSSAAGHLDIAPTLLSLLGIVDRGSVMLGRDLTANDDHLVVFRDGSFARSDDYLLTTDRSGPTCFRVGGGIESDCSELALEQRQAIDRLEVSDLIIRGGIPWPLPAGPVQSRVRLSELPTPRPYSDQFTLGNVRITGADLEAPAPSGASFLINALNRHVNLVFTPSFSSKVARNKTDGVTFQVWREREMLYEQSLRPEDVRGPVVVPIADGHDERVWLTFLTTAAHLEEPELGGTLWKDVAIVFGSHIE
jgi:lipoteichoic acid synthase